MRDEQIIELGGEVEKLLPQGWKFIAKQEDIDRSFFIRETTNGQTMKFGFNRSGSDKARVVIATYKWPEYKTTERGQPRTETVFPNSLYDPKESGFDITVAIERGAGKIAAEINRRFLPEYERIWARCQAKVDSAQDYENKSQTAWQEVCTILGGKNPAQGSHYLGEGYSARVEHRGEKAHFEMDMTPEQLRKVAMALDLPVSFLSAGKRLGVPK